MDSPPFPGAAIEAAREAAKAHLRIVGDQEDALIEGLAMTALALAEQFTGTALIARDFSEEVESKGRWKALGWAPVTAIDAGIDIAIDIDTQGLGRVRATTRASVGYRAGTAAGWSDLPPPIATGVVLLVAHLFDHREQDMAPPAAVSALWRPYRRVRLAA
jgi:hypothetical protein